MKLKSIYFPNREFATKAELFDAIRKDEARIKALKKAELIFSHERGHISKTNVTIKDNASKALTIEDGYIYPVISTTNYIDSHGDVHIDGCFKKTVSEQQGKIFYAKNHDVRVGSIIAWPEDVEMMVKKLDWATLGKEFKGESECLIFKINKENIDDDDAEDLIEKGRPVQNSIRMQYVNFVTCIDDKRPEYKNEKANWDKYYPMVANKEVADAEGYFWAVLELKIVTEGSMVVRGSNDATPLLQNPSPEDDMKCTNCNEMMSGEYCSSCGSQRKKSEPPQGTTDSEAAKALAQKKKELLIKLINNK
jgi:hypothetical protein